MTKFLALQEDRYPGRPTPLLIAIDEIQAVFVGRDADAPTLIRTRNHQYHRIVGMSVSDVADEIVRAGL